MLGEIYLKETLSCWGTRCSSGETLTRARPWLLPAPPGDYKGPPVLATPEGLTAGFLGLIRAVLALGAAVAHPRVGDALPVPALELVLGTLGFRCEGGRAGGSAPAPDADRTSVHFLPPRKELGTQRKPSWSHSWEISRTAGETSPSKKHSGG